MVDNDGYGDAILNMREIDAYFNSLLDLEELSPTGHYFVSQLMATNAERDESAERILCDRRHVDRLGPLTRISVALDTCSGMRGDWVSFTDLAQQAARDDFFMIWVNHLHEGTAIPVDDIIAATISTWIALDLAEELRFDVPVEMTIGPEGTLWRTVRRPIADPEGTVGVIVDLLRHNFNGVVQGEVQGRLQISLPRLEVFVGVDYASAAERRPGYEAPLVISAIAGMEMSDSIDLDDLLDEFINNVSTPKDLFLEIVRGVGLQVWIDKIIDGAEVECVGLDRLLANFIEHAHTLQDGLARYDTNPPGSY